MLWRYERYCNNTYIKFFKEYNKSLLYCIKILSVTHIEIIVLFGYQKLRDRHSQPLGCSPHYWILEWKRRGIVDTNNWWFGKYYFLKERTMSTVFDPKTNLHYLLSLWLWRVGCMFSGIPFCRLWLSFRSTVSSNLPQWGKILPPKFFGHNELKCIKSWSGVLPDSYFILYR